MTILLVDDDDDDICFIRLAPKEAGLSPGMGLRPDRDFESSLENRTGSLEPAVTGSNLLRRKCYKQLETIELS